MARTRLFATSLSLVLKSLIRSAALTASPPPRCYLFFLYWVRCRCEFGIASDFRLSKQNGIQLARCYFCFYVECFFAVVFLGLPLTFGSADRMLFNLPAVISSCYVGYFIAVVFLGLPLNFCSADRMLFNPPAVISSCYAGYFIAVFFWDCL